MAVDPRLKRLADLADLIRDQKLEALRLAAERRAATERLIAGLEADPSGDLPPIAAARAELAYQAWADQRRRELTLVLQNQTALCEARRAAARLAFGRAQVLGRLKEQTRNS